MFKKLALVLALLLAQTAYAQTTSVSGTITDAGSVVWKNGTYSLTFLPSPSNPTANYFQNGVAFNKNQIISGNLDNTGSFAGVAVPDNLTIAPSGSQWTFQVCPAATATNGCYQKNLTITGATQNITSAVTPPAIVVSVSFPGFYAAYTDAEIFGAKQGATYFNLTDSTQHICNVPVCTWLSIGGGVTGTLGNMQVAFGSGVNSIAGSNNFTYNSGSGLLTLGLGGITAAGLGTFSAGITGTGNLGSLIAGTGILGNSNVYTAGLQDFSAVTMEIPEAAGFTTNVNSTIGLDTTNNNCHIFENNADALCLAEASAPAANTILKQTNVTNGLVTASSLTDNGTTVITPEPVATPKLNGIFYIDGTTYPATSAGLTAACAAAGASGTVTISQAIVMNASVTCASGVTLRFMPPAQITTTGFTLTINGPILAPPVQIFAGTGTLVLGALANVIQALWFPGADILAQIGNGYAALPTAGGVINVSPQLGGGCYNATSTANLNVSGKAVTVIGTGSLTANSSNVITDGACINYTPTTATAAFTLDWTPTTGGAYTPGAGIQNLGLVNNACATNGGCGSSAIGLNIGLTNGGIRRALFLNFMVQGFGTGVQFNDATGFGWGVHFLNSVISYNSTGINYALTVAHENDVFTNTTIVVNGTGIQFNNATTSGDISIEGGSIDSNTVAGIALGSGVSNAVLMTTDVHWENNGTTNLVYVTGGTSTKLLLKGGDITDDTSGGTTAANWFSFGSGSAKGFAIFGGVGGRTYSGLPFNCGTNCDIDGLFTGAFANVSPPNICNNSFTCSLEYHTSTPAAFAQMNFSTWKLPEIAAAPANFAVGSFDACYADSTAHAVECTYNNDAVLPLVRAANSTTTTQALFATATATRPAFRAIATGDLPNIPLNQVVSPTGAVTTFADGNNPVTFNCAQTNDAQDCFTHGETSAATGGTLTNLLGNQAELNVSTASGSTAVPLEVQQAGVTATTGPPIIQLESTWNNASLVGQGIVENVTNTSSAAGSLLENLRVGNVTMFSVDKGGVTSIGAVGGTSGTINLLGTTSGTASITGPAVAGTLTNAVVSSNSWQVGAAGTAGGVLGLGGSTSGIATLTAPAVAGTLSNAVISSNAFQAGAAGGAGGILGMGGSTSGVATFTAPAVAGTIANPVVSSNNLKVPGLNVTNLLLNSTAPTIAGAGCGGSGATISANNGTAAFSIGTGTTPTSACTVTMPAATTGWVCDANTVSAISTTNFLVRQTGAVSTTSVVLTLFTDAAALQSYAGSDTIRVMCHAY